MRRLTTNLVETQQAFTVNMNQTVDDDGAVNITLNATINDSDGGAGITTTKEWTGRKCLLKGAVDHQPFGISFIMQGGGVDPTQTIATKAYGGSVDLTDFLAAAGGIGKGLKPSWNSRTPVVRSALGYGLSIN